MKLNPPPAPPSAATAARASDEVSSVPIALPAPRITNGASPRPATPDPLASLVRKLAGAHDRTTSNHCAPTAISGTVIAETSLDGVRYVMVRCAPKPPEAFLTLSPRERDIVNLIIKGYPNKMIAELLDISAWTVGTHLRRIFAKLGVTSRAAMVARYLHQVDGG